MLGIGRDRQHRLRRRPEQQVIEQTLVLEGDGSDRSGKREDHKEVADGQQIGSRAASQVRAAALGT